jgi:hypothetical protein
MNVTERFARESALCPVALTSFVPVQRAPRRFYAPPFPPAAAAAMPADLDWNPPKGKGGAYQSRPPRASPSSAAQLSSSRFCRSAPCRCWWPCAAASSSPCVCARGDAGRAAPILTRGLVLFTGRRHPAVLQPAARAHGAGEGQADHVRLAHLGPHVRQGSGARRRGCGCRYAASAHVASLAGGPMC